MAARKGRRNPALCPSHDLVLVKITGFVRSSRYGDLETGDFLRTDKAFAKHLVEEAKAARYVMAAPGIGAAAVGAAGVIATQNMLEE